MRLGRLTVPLAAVVLVAGCGATSNLARNPPPTLPPTATTVRVTNEARVVAIYAAVIRRLVNQDNTFGGEPSPFKKVFLLDAPTRDANVIGDEGNRGGTPFSPEVRQGLRVALGDLPPLEFVADPNEARTTDPLRPRDDGVIITLGPIIGAGDHVRVPNRLWCGGTCGQWLTYFVDFNHGAWHVIGHDGAVAIS
jgi:hypothetical protein